MCTKKSILNQLYAYPSVIIRSSRVTVDQYFKSRYKICMAKPINLSLISHGHDCVGLWATGFFPRRSRFQSIDTYSSVRLQGHIHKKVGTVVSAEHLLKRDKKLSFDQSDPQLSATDDSRRDCLVSWAYKVFVTSENWKEGRGTRFADYVRMTQKGENYLLCAFGSMTMMSRFITAIVLSISSFRIKEKSVVLRFKTKL